MEEAPSKQPDWQYARAAQLRQTQGPCEAPTTAQALQGSSAFSSSSASSVRKLRNMRQPRESVLKKERLPTTYSNHELRSAMVNPSSPLIRTLHDPFLTDSQRRFLGWNLQPHKAAVFLLAIVALFIPTLARYIPKL